MVCVDVFRPSSSHPYYARLASLSPENAQVDLLVMMSALHSSLAQLAEGSELVQSLFSLDSFQVPQTFIFPLPHSFLTIPLFFPESHLKLSPGKTDGTL